MKKTVIGLKMEYLLPALIATLVSAVCMILPYASVEGTSVTLLGLMGAGTLPMAAVVFTVVSVVLAILGFIKTSVKGAKVWAAGLAVQTALMTMLMFASKGILDASGLLPGKFLVANFGLGYWVGLIASYAALILTMKLSKINTGYVVLTLLAVIWLFPIAWIVLTALRAESGFYVGYFIPKGFTFQNFVDLFQNPQVPFGRWYSNTLIVAVCSCVINTLIVLSTAFVLSRTRFTGRKAFMNVLMIIGMFPGFMSMVAVYNILKGLGLNQSLFALVIVSAAGAAMGYHVCKGFFDTIPKALDEAAIIDGANRWQIFTKITIPLSKPIAIYTLLTSFLGAWSDYIFPSMLFGDNQANYTVAIGLKWMTDFRRVDTYYTQFAAGALVVAIPIVILFVCLQKYYVEGLSGSVKG